MPAPYWLPLAATAAAAVCLWLAIYKPRRQVSLLSLLVLLALLAVAFKLAGRPPPGAIEIESTIEK